MNGAEQRGYVIYLNWDGFAYEWYRLVNESYGGTPNLNALLQKGVLFTNVGTGIPSITGAMQQCIASGAWPADTGNCHRYYDVGLNRVIQFQRHNPLENIAEAAVRSGVSLAAVNAWYFENRGTFEGNVEQPYIRVSLPSNFAERVDEMIKVINGEPVATGDVTMRFDDVPRFLSIYADDIDTVAHNGRVTYEGLRVAETRQMWYDNICETIRRMDADLGRLVHALKKRGVFERTTIVLTTDHGMAPYGAAAKDLKAPFPEEAISCLPDLAETIAETGVLFRGERYKVELLCQEGMQAQDDTDIVVTTVTLQAQINFRIPVEWEVIAEIVSRVQRKNYYGTHLDQEELLKRGAFPGFADLVVSPEPPFHFRWDGDDVPRAVGANHDSLHKHVQHVFTMMSGAGVIPGITYEEQVWMVDMAPTMARLLGFEGPRDAVGTVLDGVLATELRGPKLELLGQSEGWNQTRYAVEKSGSVGSDNAVEVAGYTTPHAAVRINRQAAGNADQGGLFTVQHRLEPGLNRLVVEVEANRRISRKTVYIYSASAERCLATQGRGIPPNDAAFAETAAGLDEDDHL